MKFKKILWPTDFSSNAEKALPYVQSLTQQYDAEVHILYVIQDIAHHKSWYGEFGEKGNFPFGSVTEKVLKNSKIPVTAIPIVPDITA